MTDNVIEFPSETTADKILTGAAEAGLKQVIVIGRNQDDNIYFAFSMGYGPDVLWLLERVKQALMGTEQDDISH